SSSSSSSSSGSDNNENNNNNNNDNVILFTPKPMYEFDLYLTHLLLRAQKLNPAFQLQLKQLFRECKGCHFVSCPVLTFSQCQQKAELDHKHARFPKTAHVLDIISCQAMFDTWVDLKCGLTQLLDFVQHHKDPSFTIMCVQNELGIVPQSTTRKAVTLTTTTTTANVSNANRGTYNETGEKTAKHFWKLSKSLKIYLVFTCDEESIVGQVELLLKATARYQRQYNDYLKKLEEKSLLIYGASKEAYVNSFDFQLQIAGFDHHALAPLMLFYPLQFKHSELILNGKDAQKNNFVAQMANETHLQYNCAKELLHSNQFIPTQVVQKQLVEPNEFGAYPLMYALRRQSYVDAILLFVPSDASNANLVWNALDKVNK
ncbi:hypothetical protein RFI_05559, partial [Reticulomyxa filosa]